jgi:phosphatidylglycerophosphate synthase
MQRQIQVQPLKKLFAAYRANRYDEEILTDWGSALIYRPIGITLAWLLTATRITPNVVTATGALLLPAIVVVAILFQPAAALAIVLVLAIVYLILDCTDGSLARATGHVSVSGHYWDLVTDLAYRGCIYAAVGYLADQIFPWPFPVSQMSCMALAAWFAALARLARQSLDKLTPQGIVEKPDRKAPGAYTFYSFLSGLDTLFPPLVAVAWAAGLLSFFIAWLVFYSFADVIIALLEARGRLRSYQS